MVSAPNASIFDTTGTAVLVIKFKVAFRCEDLFLVANQIIDPKLLQQDISNILVIYISQSFSEYVFVHMNRTLAVTTISTKNQFEERKGGRSTSSRVLDESASTVFLDNTHQIEELCDL